MNTTLFFWICWIVELIAFLVIGGDLWGRYSQRASIPMAPDQLAASGRYLIILVILLLGGLTLRYLGRPEWAFYAVASPVVLLLVFFLIAAIAIIFGIRVN